MLDLNEQQTQVGPSPDPVDVTPERRREICALVEAQVRGGDPENPRNCFPFFFPEQVLQVVHPEVRPGWSLKGHMNGQHAAHVTNLHTHGLHVSPDTNPDGTHSDNVLLRILPKADWLARLQSDDADLHTLGKHEHVAELDYEIRMAFERNGTTMAHPPGTHWYHPHSHGATDEQVASGMAGFLIVEGDVDEAINTAMTGEAWPDPELKGGPFDYRERLIFVQRVLVQSFDLDAGPKRNSLRFPPFIAVNGVMPAAVMFMRPGAVERWRILNGSVDGTGTKRFMVLRGQYVFRDERLWRVVVEGEGSDAKRRLEKVSQQELEDAKVPLHQLSFDGITLVKEENGKARHRIKDLSLQNAGTQNPFASSVHEGEDDARAMLQRYEACFRDGDSLRRSFVRPNELYLGNANRADVFFKAPLDAAGETFTIFAQEAHIHNDNLQFLLQRLVRNPDTFRRRPLFDVVVGYVHIKGDPVEGGDFDVQSLNDVLPPVQPLLLPIGPEELKIPSQEAVQSGVPAGSARTRVVSYSGTGGADFPSIRVPDAFAQAHPELRDLVWGMHEDVPVLLPNLTRTMAINTEFDLARNPDPEPPRKFMPHDPKRSRMLANTAEEWVLYNCSQMLWSHTDRERFPQPGSYTGHYVSYPLSRAEGQRRFWEDHEFRISSKGVDHPFHIHINPMWVLRVDVPDEQGVLHNILPEPCWMDTVPIPRNGGRVVFRTRFDDFVGTWVHHCHILSHEDMGMMQVVECTDRPEDANYVPRGSVASAGMSVKEVDAIYPPPSREIMYRQNLSFVDPNEIGYQVYPGFDLEVPRLIDASESSG
jgi:FtsP/CotA-like multicopper oxidase with cupredoxin domain